MLFVKCDNLDKYHLCPIQPEGWPVAGTSLRSYSEDELAEAIIRCIPEDPRLSNLFLRWAALSQDDKNAVDLDLVLPPTYFNLYVPLMKALTVWEFIQDHNGAPGYQRGLFALSCNSILNEELALIIDEVGGMLGQ